MKIPCSNCNQRLEISEEFAGQTLECPACNASLSAPAMRSNPAMSPLKTQSVNPNASNPKTRPKSSLTTLMVIIPQFESASRKRRAINPVVPKMPKWMVPVTDMTLGHVRVWRPGDKTQKT